MYTARPGASTPLISHNLPYGNLQIAPARAKADWAISITAQDVDSPHTIAKVRTDDTRWQDGIDRLCEALFHGGEDDDWLVTGRSAATLQLESLPHPAGSDATEVGWTFLSDAQRTRTSIPPTRAQKSRAQTPEPIPKPHRSPRSKPARAPSNARPSCRKRQFWVAACLLLCGLFFWKSLPQDVSRPAAQSAADSVPTVLASADQQPRYITESIERLRIGDMVLAMDPATGEIGHHRVVDHFQRTAYELRVLEFIGLDAKRQRIETTDEHPFFVLSEGAFIPAAELEIGDQCPGPQGEIQTLVATRLEPRPEGVPVFNFEVQHAHTYYVQAEDLLGDPLLVHNTCHRKGWKYRNRYAAAYDEYINNAYYGSSPARKPYFRTSLGKRFLDNSVRVGNQRVGVENKFLRAKPGTSQVDVGKVRGTQKRAELAETLKRIRQQARKDAELLNQDRPGLDRIDWNLSAGYPKLESWLRYMGMNVNVRPIP